MNTIHLRLTDEQRSRLQQCYHQFRQELEKHRFPTHQTLERLQFALSEALDQQDGFPDLYRRSQTRPETLCLCHPNTTVRNLPWQLALQDRPLCTLLKADTTHLPAYTPNTGLPLKVLVMVSAPEGAVLLDYEREELRLLQALAPLMSRGLAQVHFTDDGSLENLAAKLRENRYHVLHFSGHGYYKDGIGYLVAETEDNGQRRDVTAREFNDILAKAARRGRRPELVLLSACQTAQGETVGDLQGVADTLLASGLPAVIGMAESILDVCAIEFAATLYRSLAEEAPLPVAFGEAVQALRSFESGIKPPDCSPGQWLIPQLQMCAQIESVFDTEAPAEELDFQAGMEYVGGAANLLELRGTDRKQYPYVFIGRRTERRRAQQALDAGRIVLLRGQGGVGKTALAEHLARRRMAANQRVKVFTHSEKAPPATNLLQQMEAYLTRDKRELNIVRELQLLEKQEDRLNLLLDRTGRHSDPLFIFDNAESFQQDQGGPWKHEHSDVLEAIRYMRQYTRYPLLLTGRHSVPELEAETAVIDLNAVDFGDFYKKCWQLPLHQLAGQLHSTADPGPARKENDPAPRPGFEDVCRLLHRCFGGNYRALEFFDRLYAEQPGRIHATLNDLKTLETQLRDRHEPDSVLNQMSENLVFGELLGRLTPREEDALYLLARFRIPVLPMAVAMQRDHIDFSAALNRLADLTLAERQPGADGHTRYYAMPLVRNLLPVKKVPFEAEVAGAYHERVYDEDFSENHLADYHEAFEWYGEAGLVEAVNRTGTRLCGFYFDRQLFQLAYAYGTQTEAVAGEHTEWQVLNNLGRILKLFGHNDRALEYYERNLKMLQAIGDRKGEGTTLNNISQIYDAKGDYDTALRYLEQSLTIQQAIGDRSGEGTTLNNISGIHRAKGDYDTALRYLEQSLTIRQAIGDVAGMANTLHNMGTISFEHGDLERATVYCFQSYSILQQLGSPHIQYPAQYLQSILEQIGEARFQQILQSPQNE